MFFDGFLSLSLSLSLSSSFAFKTTIFLKETSFENCIIFSVFATRHYKNAAFTWAVSVCLSAWNCIRHTKWTINMCVNTLEFP